MIILIDYIKRLLGHKDDEDEIIIRGVKFRDTAQMAFQYRMPAGFAGDVNRTHPFSVEPCMQHPTTPATAFGQAVLVDTATNAVRPLVAADSTATEIYGITVRPFPFQQAAAAGPYGQQLFTDATPVPGAGNTIDVLRWGYIMVQLNPAQTQPKKGGAVFVRAAATSGNNIQGGFESAASTSASLSARYTYNGPGDANLVCEICIR